MKRIIAVLVLTSFVFHTFAQDQEKKKEIPKAETFTSTQTVTIKGKTISLATETGTVQLRDENDKPIALFGFTHYRKTNSSKNRPMYLPLMADHFLLLSGFILVSLAQNG